MLNWLWLTAVMPKWLGVIFYLGVVAAIVWMVRCIVGMFRG